MAAANPATDPNQIDVRNRGEQIRPGQGMSETLDVLVPGSGEALDGGFVNAFEKKDASVFSSHGRSLGRSYCCRKKRRYARTTSPGASTCG